MSAAGESGPKPTLWCIDYGHHGRDRCVFCGLKRPSDSGGDAS